MEKHHQVSVTTSKLDSAGGEEENAVNNNNSIRMYRRRDGSEDGMCTRCAVGHGCHLRKHLNLARAAQYGNVDRMMDLLEAGENINDESSRDAFGNTALHHIILYGNDVQSQTNKTKIVKLVKQLLLNHGADPTLTNSKTQYDALCTACESDYIPTSLLAVMCEIGIQKLNSDDSCWDFVLKAIKVSIFGGQRDKMQFLVTKLQEVMNSKVNNELENKIWCNILQMVLKHSNNDDIFRYLLDPIQNPDLLSAMVGVLLHEALALGKTNLIKWLLDYSTSHVNSDRLSNVTTLAFTHAVRHRTDSALTFLHFNSNLWLLQERKMMELFLQKQPYSYYKLSILKRSYHYREPSFTYGELILAAPKHWFIQEELSNHRALKKVDFMSENRRYGCCVTELVHKDHVQLIFKHPDLLKVVYNSGAPMKDLVIMLETFSNIPEKVQTMLMDVTYQPRSLLCTCRIYIRRHLVGNAYNCLPIPKKMKEFLMRVELDHPC